MGVSAYRRAARAQRDRRRPRPRRPDFAPSSETPGGYVGQAVLESDLASKMWTGRDGMIGCPDGGVTPSSARIFFGSTSSLRQIVNPEA
jgi:hypothetical protein